MQAVYGGRDVRKDFLNALFAVDVDEDSAVGVEAEKRARLGVEHLESVCNGKLVVVGPSFVIGAGPIRFSSSR